MIMITTVLVFIDRLFTELALSLDSLTLESIPRVKPLGINHSVASWKGKCLS